MRDSSESMSSVGAGASIYWSIGIIPVQDWIVQARRSRDLRSGSVLLSWTMAKLLDTIGQKLGAELLLPQFGPGGDRALVHNGLIREFAGRSFDLAFRNEGYSIPSRASGRVIGQSFEDVKRVFELLQEEVVDKAWDDILVEVTNGNGSFPENSLGRLIWGSIQPHLSHSFTPFRLVWCLRALAGGAVIADGLKEIESLYAAVKRTRPIPAHQGYSVPKCGQCGQRETIGGNDKRSWSSFHDGLNLLLEKGMGQRIDVKELLCSTCLTKRLAGYLSAGPFASTHEIAAREWLFRIESSEDLHELLRSLRKAIQGTPGYDTPTADPYGLYFTSTVDRVLQSAPAEQRPQLQVVRDRLHRLREAIEGSARQVRLPVRPQPSSYLAVLTFDGDNIGPAVQEHFDTLPTAIMQFAADIAALSETHRATPFYVGGDEGLLLCPIENLLDLARDLRSAWSKRVPKRPDGTEVTTISTGVAVFDRERPLGAAIRAAYGAIQQAKEMDGKDSLAITVQTASGNEWTTCASWGPAWERVRLAADAVREGKLSAGWAYDVERLINSLPVETWARPEMAPAILAELRRLTKRRTPLSLDDQRGTGTDLWAELNGESWWRPSQESSEHNYLANQLHFVAFLVREAGVGTTGEMMEEPRDPMAVTTEKSRIQ